MSTEIACGLTALLHDQRSWLIDDLHRISRAPRDAYLGSAKACRETVSLLLSLLDEAALTPLRPASKPDSAERFMKLRAHVLCAMPRCAASDYWYFLQDCKRAFRNCLLTHWTVPATLPEALDAVHFFFERAGVVAGTELPGAQASGGTMDTGWGVEAERSIHMAVFEAVSEAIFVLADTGRIVRWNSAAQAVFGDAHADDTGVIPRALRRGLEDGFASFSSRSTWLELATPQGVRRFKVLRSGIAASEDRRAGSVVILRSEVDDAGVSHELELSEAKLALAVRAGQLGMFEYLAVDSVVLSDSLFAQRFGYPDQHTSQSLESLLSRIHIEDRRTLLAALERHFAGDTPFFTSEFRHKAPADGWRWMQAVGEVAVRDLFGRPLRMVGLFQDIHDRKVGEARLREGETRLKAVLDHAPALIVMKDTDGRTLLANRRYLALPEQLEQALCAQRDNDQKALHAGEAVVVEEGFIEHDGAEHTYLSIKFPMYLDGNDAYADSLEPYATCAISTDITERKRVEQELRRRLDELGALNDKLENAQHQLLQSEKMASIGLLAAGVAHELNNPIGFVHSNFGSLKGYVDDIFEILDAYEQLEQAPGVGQSQAFEAVRHLKRKKDLAFMREDTAALIEESRDGLARVRRIVQDLKDFSHVSETDWQWADLHVGLDSTLNIVHNELKYKAVVVKEYAQLPEIYCVQSQLNQVFMNLLVNAGHAIDAQGTITIRTGWEQETVWVEFADTGRGIAPEHQARVFEPFFTTKAVGQGTGLGLSLSYGIIKKHHGRITVNSIPGEGTTFRVVLPINPELEAVSTP